jgi:hypothetical protein
MTGAMTILVATMKDAVTGTLAALLLMLTGCGAPPAQPAPVALTDRITAVVAAEHLGPAFAAFSASVSDGQDPASVGATLHYRATATRRLWSASVSYGPSMPMITGQCEPLASEAPQPTCFWQDGVRIAWFTATGPLYLTSARHDQFVNVAVVNLTREADPRKGSGHVPLERLVALAADPRLDATTPAALAVPAASFPGWTEDPGCEHAASVGPIPLPATSGPATESISPQAIAAVVASHVAGTCAADWNPVTPGPIGGMVYTKPGREWVAAYFTTDDYYAHCGTVADCTSSDGVTTSFWFGADETQQSHLRLVRRIGFDYLVVDEAALGVDPATRVFPVQLAVLHHLFTDPRLTHAVDPALNEAGERLAICWRLLDYTGE